MTLKFISDSDLLEQFFVSDPQTLNSILQNWINIPTLEIYPCMLFLLKMRIHCSGAVRCHPDPPSGLKDVFPQLLKMLLAENPELSDLFKVAWAKESCLADSHSSLHSMNIWCRGINPNLSPNSGPLWKANSELSMWLTEAFIETASEPTLSLSNPASSSPFFPLHRSPSLPFSSTGVNAKSGLLYFLHTNHDSEPLSWKTQPMIVILDISILFASSSN